MKFQKSMRWAAAGVLSCAAWGMSAGAAAASPEITAPTPTVVQGSRAYQSVTFDFLAAYPMSGIDLYLDYDPTGLSFVEGASTVAVGGVSRTLPEIMAFFDAQAPLGSADSDSQSGSYVLYLNVATALEDWPVIPAGKVVLTAAFDITPGYVGDSELTVSGVLYGEAAELPPLFEGDGLAGFATISISAVPEPQTWAMLLGGVALMLGVARRRGLRSS